MQLSSQRGAALLTAVILATAVGIIVAHILSTSMTEKNLTARTVARIHADNVAEMVVDYGLSEIAGRFSEDSAFASDEFSPSFDPLLLRSEFKDALKDAGVDLDSLFLTAGKLSLPVRYYIDPNDPANMFDPHKGMNVYVRTVDLFGRATVVHPRFGNITSYSRLTVQIRDAPLFAYGIFYNMDLEFHPGPKMIYTGNIHCNGTVWLNAASELKFEGAVTATKDIRVGFKRTGQQTTWSSQTGKKVYFRNADGKFQSLYRGDGRSPYTLESYYTSLSADDVFSDLGYENWREYAFNEFAGNLQSGIHGVPQANPSGVRPYVPDEDGATEKENHGYSLIEPNLDVDNPYHKAEAEREKFARKAGLIIRVHRDLDRDGVDDERGVALPAVGLRVPVRRRPDIDEGWSSAARDFLTYYEETDDDKEAEDPVKVAEKAPDAPSEFETGYYLSFHMLKRVDQKDPTSALVLNTKTITTTDADGDSITRTIDGISEVDLPLNDAFDFDNTDTVYEGLGDTLRAQFDEAFAAHPYWNEKETGMDHNGDGDTKDFVSGMIDQRVAQASPGLSGNGRLDLIEINLGAFADIVEDEDHPLFKGYTPRDFYNGVVYVEFPIDKSVTPRPKDKIVRSYEKVGVILTEAGGKASKKDGVIHTPRIPNPDYNKVSSRDEGFTLATNVPLYTRGHFNSDGKLDGKDPMGPDDSSDPNPPAALAADAITVLSDKWEFKKSVDFRPGASNTEVTAAFLAGVLPTNEGGRSVTSGGNHNFIRFLEKWGTLRYRGSMACAFESEIQADPQETAKSYYSPPKREWGYYKLFADGTLPPGTPSYASYRKSAFEFLNAGEFQAALDAFPWKVTPPPLP